MEYKILLEFSLKIIDTFALLMSVFYIYQKLYIEHSIWIY